MVPACPLLFCEPVGLTVLSRCLRRSDTWETPLLSLPVQTHPVSAQGKVHPHVPVLLTATHPLHLQPNIILACLPIVSLAFPPGGGGFWGCKPTLVTGPTGPRADGPLLFVSQSIQLIERESNQRPIGWMKGKKNQYSGHVWGQTPVGSSKSCRRRLWARCASESLKNETTSHWGDRCFAAWR